MCVSESIVYHILSQNDYEGFYQFFIKYFARNSTTSCQESLHTVYGDSGPFENGLDMELITNPGACNSLRQ